MTYATAIMTLDVGGRVAAICNYSEDVPMSRPFLVGILAIMLGLLGVMSFYVKADPKKEQEKAQLEAAEAQKKASDEEAKKQQQTAMQDQAKQKMKDMAAQINRQNKMPDESPANLAKKIPTVPKQPAENPNDDMTWDWAKRRKPGEAGMREVIKTAEEKKKKTPPPVMQTQGASAMPTSPGAALPSGGHGANDGHNH